jgi:hypothetical protein
MRELNGLSHEEIATVLGTSVGAAKQAIFEARSALLEMTEGREMACDEVRHRLSDGDGRALRGRRIRAHLRDCGGCAAFAAAIPARETDLRALTPVMPAAASAALLRHVLGGGAGKGATGAGSGAAVAGAAGKTAGGALLAKGLAGVAVVATAAAGVGGVSTLVTRAGHARHATRGAASVRTASSQSRTAAAAPRGLGAATATRAINGLAPAAKLSRTATIAGRALRHAGARPAATKTRANHGAVQRSTTPAAYRSHRGGNAYGASKTSHAGGNGKANSARTRTVSTSAGHSSAHLLAKARGTGFEPADRVPGGTGGKIQK